MKKLINRIAGLWLLLSLVGVGVEPVLAHGGEDHGAGTAPTGAGRAYFVTQAVSDKYELVLHYEPLKPGEAGTMRLYINEFNTNQPVEGATLTFSSPGEAKLTFAVKPTGKGI